MKRLTCEMCGSTDLIKKEGVFECQTCGTKYSVEEAKKMMVEGTVEIAGTVDVQGTVKVDNTDIVEKYLQNAHRAKAKEDWEETEKYYNLVEQNAPNNIEAIFYSAYAKAKNSLIVNDIFKREATFKVLCNCVSIIDDHYNYDNKDDLSLLDQICDDVCDMSKSTFVFTQTTTTHSTQFGSFDTHSDDSTKTYKLFGDLFLAFKESLVNIALNYDESCVEEKIHIYELAIKLLNAIGYFSATPTETLTELYNSIIALDPTYKNNSRVFKIKYVTNTLLIKKTVWISIDDGKPMGFRADAGYALLLLSEGKHKISWLDPKKKTTLKSFNINIGLAGISLKITPKGKKDISITVIK